MVIALGAVERDSRNAATIEDMRCPKCTAEVPDSDYVCGQCGAYTRASRHDAGAQRTLEAGHDELLFSHARVPDPAALDALLAIRARKSARRWARWSMVLAALALVFPVFFGPIGFASGYVAWRLGERRLGSLGAALSAIGMIVGIVLAAVALSIRGGG